MNTFRTHAERLGICTARFLGALEHLLLRAQAIRSKPGCFYDNVYEGLRDKIEIVKMSCVELVKAAMQREPLGEEWFYGFSDTLPSCKLARPFYQSETSDTEVSETISNLVKALFTLLNLSDDDKYLFLDIGFDGNRNSFEVTNRLTFHNPHENVCDALTRLHSANISCLQSLVEYGSEKLVIAISYIVDSLLFIDYKKINDDREKCKKLLFDLRRQMSPHLFHTTKISSNGEVQRAGYDSLPLAGKQLHFFEFIFQASSENRLITREDAANAVYREDYDGKALVSRLKNEVNKKIRDIGLCIPPKKYRLISID